MQQQAYTVEFECQRRLSVAEWLAIERGQISEVATRVNNALLSVVTALNGQASTEKDPTHFAVLTDELYWHLLKSAKLDTVLELKTAPVDVPIATKEKKVKWVEKPKKGAIAEPAKIGASGVKIQSESSKKKLEVIGKEMDTSYQTALRTTPKGVSPLPRILAAMLRFLRSELFEVRAITLMVFAHHLNVAPLAGSGQGGRPQTSTVPSSTTAANELDAAIQRFMEPVVGRLFIDPSRAAPPSAAMDRDVREWLRRLRCNHPFDGVNLAVTAPRIIWSTRYDDCLTEAPIRARANQQESIQQLHGLAERDCPFLFMNRAPPGAGKSTLLTPISVLLTTSALIPNASGASTPRELYVCAGQGRFGVTQFAQALYSAGIPFSTAFIEYGKLVTVKQHSNRDRVSRVFVGTADAIAVLASQPERVGWVVIDEPTYGADIPGSRPCREIMSLIAALPLVNRRLIMFGATLPDPATIPNIVSHFRSVTVVNGGLDSVQIACDVRTLSGRELYPHTGCRTATEVLAVRNQVATRPFLARMYTVGALVRLRDILAGEETEGELPDLQAIFNTAKSLRPATVVATTNLMLQYLAEQPPAVIASVCSVAPTRLPPIDFGALVTSQPPDHQVMIVDVDPLKFAMSNFKPLLEALRTAKVDVAALYKTYDTECGVITSEGKASARRRGAGESQSGNTGEEGHTGKKISFSENRKGGKGSADGTAEPGFIPDELDDARTKAKLNFPEWAQVGTASHRARFGSTLDTPCRAPIRPESVTRGAVDTVTQTLLLAGIGIISTKDISCAEYTAEVWRRASTGALSIIVTNHGACYGANMMTGTVIITDAFARVASTATLEQAGGRLCRVGLTYRGQLVLPDTAADQLFTDIRSGSAAAVEAANMEREFNDAIARGRRNA